MIETEALYAAFMLDYSSGALSPAETLAASLHCALSPQGARSARIFDTVGAALLVDSAPMPVEREDAAASASADAAPPSAEGAAADRDGRKTVDLARLASGDLLGLRWRRSLLGGVQTFPMGLAGARLLRLNPGERAWRHGHDRGDVTVVLQGAYADEFGVYRRGDIAFAVEGMKHQPTAIGDLPCVCLIAEEARGHSHGMAWRRRSRLAAGTTA